MTKARDLAQIVSSGVSEAFKNRIINGAMVIDQRNAGASVTPTANGTLTLDRWSTYVSVASKFSVQRNAGSVTPPAGYINYLGCTSTSAYSVAAGDFLGVYQRIEGFNCADLDWGTANAKTVTLSFWVRSSLTGTFGGSFSNSAFTRSYPFSYTISAANTWEQKTITVAGDTTGTWLTNNGTGIEVAFSLGMGSTYSGTANTWAGTWYGAPTGATSVVGTNGATFYITGVQLEVGSTATSFDYRPYGTELALCQRYAIRYAGAQVYELIGIIFTESSTSTILIMPLPVFMRTTPSVSFSTLRIVENQGAAVAVTAVNTKGSEGGNKVAFLNPTAASGLTASRSGWLSANNSTSAFLLLSAEL
jgi:hypothetical protein